MMHITEHRSNSGFAMVVIAALFVAFSVVAAVAVERTSIMQFITNRDAAVDQLTRLNNAIIEYAVMNKTGSTLLYPCPAPDNAASNSAAFGTAMTGCSTGLVAGVAGLSGSTDIIRGMVPVYTLSPYGISLNDAFDPWNNRIAYVVNRRLTLGSSTSLGAQASNPTLTEKRTGAALASPDFILVSYGRDGVGAIKRSNTSVSIPCVNGSPASTLRYENCDDDISFYQNPTYTPPNTSAADYFDDVLSYYRQ